jgi:hypothetical protein
MERTPLSIVLLLGALTLPSAASAYSGGPPDRLANNPPLYENCTVCHFSFELNSGDGALELQGLPAEYHPGQLYTLTVMLADPGPTRWGFELTVLDDADFYAEGGSLLVTDPVHTQLSGNIEGTEDYLKHTSTGTYRGTGGGASWTFDWLAPDLPSVTFYVVGNAADADDSFIGDYIYGREYRLERHEPTPTLETTWGRIKTLYQR